MKIVNEKIEFMYSNCDPDCSTDNCSYDGDDTSSCGGVITH